MTRPVDEDINGTMSALRTMLADRARESGEQPALRAGLTWCLSYRQLDQYLQHLSELLLDHGVAEQHRIAVCLPRAATTAVLQLGITAHGSCVPINPDARPDEVADVLRRSGTDLMIAPSGSSAAKAAADTDIPCWGADVASGLPIPDVAPDQPRQPTTHRAALLLQTSGSTAAPKLVPLQQKQLLQSARYLVDSVSLGADDCALSMMPMFHIGAFVDLLLAPLLVGGQVRFSEALLGTSALEALKPTDGRTPVTWLQAVPAMLQDLLIAAEAHPAPGPPHRLRFIRAVSSPLPAALRSAAERRFQCPVISIYGMSETAGVITSQRPDAEHRPANGVGRSAGPELRIRSNTGDWAGAGEAGEVWVRGETIIAGYEGADPADDPNFDNGWLRTGDLGCLDADGELQLLGRIKELINRGGEKIAPLEIDQHLLTHPDVTDAAAFALPHATLGEDVAAAVVLRPEAEFDPAALREFLRPMLSSHKLPRRIVALPSLPLGRTGKLQRRALPEIALADAPPPRAAGPRSGPPALQVVIDSWAAALGLDNVEPDVDIFDQGADSLSAVSFVAELAARTGIQISPAVLFDHPTPAALLEHLTAEHSDSLVPPAAEPVSRGALPPALLEELMRVMAAWPGQRPHPHSLLVKRGTHGPGIPLFWGVQGEEEFRAVADAMDGGRPVYGFRSLFGLRDKNASNLSALAAHLADEIEHIRPQGPLLIGGYCAGGGVAVEIAATLQARGRRVELLCLLDTPLNRAVHADLLLFHSRNSFAKPGGRFLLPSRGWGRYARGRCATRTVESRYGQALARGQATEFLRQLCEKLKAFDAGSLSWPDHTPLSLPQRDNRDYRSELISLGADHWSPGESRQLRVQLHNRSDQTWLPTSDSGLIVGACFRRMRPDLGPRTLAAHAELLSAVKPGASATLSLTIRAPWRPRRYVLEIDLIDDGVSWFSDHHGVAHRQTIRVIPGGRWLGRRNPRESSHAAL